MMPRELNCELEHAIADDSVEPSLLSPPGTGTGGSFGRDSARVANTSATSDCSIGAWRSILIIVCFAMAGTALGARLIHLQWVGAAGLGRLAERQSSVQEVVAAQPGDIVDRNGRLLATSVLVRSVYIVPAALTNAWDTVAAIADATGVDREALFAEISSRPKSQFLWVKRRVSDTDVDRIRSLGLSPQQCGFREEYLRRYPQGVLAAHVLGLRDIDGEGRGGIEESCQRQIRGRDGVRELLLDSRGRVIDVREQPDRPCKNGETVRLSLDVVVQLHCELALDQIMRDWQPNSACAIVVDPQNGEVLAMASRPTFDPNRAESADETAWTNSAINSIFEPGSTLKPAVVAWGLEHGFVSPDEEFDCEHGAYRMGRRILHDHHKYGVLSLCDVLVKSSNIGMAKIGERMGNDQLFAAVRAFGFGRPTGIELPGEQSGIVHPLERWNDYSTGSIPMGQEISATPLQVLATFVPIANGGRWITPHLLLPAAETGYLPPQVIVSPIVSAETCRWMRTEALTAVVDRGTGRKARLDGWTVFGKTGTAQKLDRETGTYSHSRHVTSFVCGAPATDPRVLVIVSADEPRGTASGERFGGEVAAPAAAKILKLSLEQLRTRIAFAEQGPAKSR